MISAFPFAIAVSIDFVISSTLTDAEETSLTGSDAAEPPSPSVEIIAITSPT